MVDLNDQRFLAYLGLVTWCEAVLAQAERITDAMQAIRSAAELLGQMSGTPDQLVQQANARMMAQRRFTYERHLFIIAADQLMAHRDWAERTGVVQKSLLASLTPFESAVSDLRNMNEHAIDYLRGKGNNRDRWMIETPEFRSDASATVGTLLGGRLDWVQFRDAVAGSLPSVRALQEQAFASMRSEP